MVLSMGQIKLFDVYTECKQMTCYIEMFDHLTNDWRFNSIVSDAYQYIKPFNYVQKKWVMMDRIICVK